MALSNLTKVQTLGIGSNIEVVGVITTGQFKSGTSNLHSSGVELTNLNVSGIATIGGNVSIGGTLTYQDVTNIDSVGIITARSTIDAQGSINLADSIIHTGDTDTKIRFPAANTVAVETAGSERLRITSAGSVGINETSPDRKLHVRSDGAAAAKLGGESGAAYYMEIGQLASSGSPGFNATGSSASMLFQLNGSEKVRIDSSGRLLVATNSASGTNSGADDLVIGNTSQGNNGMSIVTNNANIGGIFFADQDNTVRGGVRYQHAIDLAQFYAGGSVVLNLKNKGVGINETSPASDALIIRGGDTDDTPSLILKRATDGTQSAGEIIGKLQFMSNENNVDSGNYQPRVEIKGETTDTVGGAAMVLSTAAGSATSPTERLRITSDGKLIKGHTSNIGQIRTQYQTFTQLYGSSNSTGLKIGTFSNDAYAGNLEFIKSRSATIGTNTLVQNNDNLGSIYWGAADGSQYQPAAVIAANMDGSTGTNDIPTRLTFFTTADGANGASERLRIQSNGYLGINNSGPQRFLSVKETNNKASILIWRTSESNADYSGIDFIGHPSNNGTNYQKGGIYWQTDGSGFGRGDMVFCNDGAADANNVIISNEKLRIHKEGPVTKPNMPVASFSDNRAVDISNAILTSSNFYNHQWWNEGGHFNTSNGRFTCPVDGVYRIYFRATCDTNEHTNVRLRKNGGTINEAYANYSSGQTSSDSSEAIVHCSTNDYLEIQVSRLKTSGGTQHKQVTFQLLH